MDSVDEVVAVAPPPPPSYDNELQDVVVSPPAIAKGKRTKRQRLPLPTLITTTTCTTNINRLSPSFSSAAATSSEESTTTEEEDTARCLILLARGGGGHFQTRPLDKADGDDEDGDRHDYIFKQNSSRKRRAAETNAAGYKGGGACMYACKTCGRVFPSFQALGGHRASHKKPRNEKRTVIFFSDEEFLHKSQKRLTPPPPTSLSLQLSNLSAAAAPRSTFPSPKIHVCSYCGADFSSGQALGGHMRRHRPILTLSPSNIVAARARGGASVDEPEPEPEPEEWMKGRNGLTLDLNLPAPDDENQRRKEGGAPEKLVLTTGQHGCG
ncbi:hypothetical protein ABFS82_06G162900 [Erythranthe guttata]|uniref:C2H2-type domain-containing protein n=1 Tax=Erythranthe guttata TaxID=4155 RepID=A0A022R0Z3_ERYGU|nr:PREDICTED: zinc finger protein ZAT5-like [Erythranthe guttata]EYU32430.1 hypothetical protein MIMGU_mgv1a010048mg [Erythranthe guttata]|eukprot:XP_012843339.1 PREDICTED: zinc finger protein ZAT5-like [Erythranthe guttata]